MHLPKEWQKKDPIRRLAEWLGMDEAELEAMKKDAREKIEAAVDFAEASPEPDISTIMEGVYA